LGRVLIKKVKDMEVNVILNVILKGKNPYQNASLK